MANLILSMDGLVLKEYQITKERTTIGRKPHNDIQIDNLAVSGEHAVIVTILNDSFLEDLGSTNGTLVNGQPIKKHFLQHNDVVELGKYKLKYVNEAATSKQGAQDFERTMVLRPGAAPKVEAKAEPKPEPKPEVKPEPPKPAAQSQTVHTLSASQPVKTTTMPPSTATTQPTATQPAASGPVPTLAPAAIQILTGANAGKELDLVKPLTTLGKPGVQVAVITRRPQGYFITHVEGAAFPVVNGKALDAQAHQLNNHDVIELAGVKMEFYYKA